MTCDDVRRRLTAYLDGELEDDRGSAVRGHLRGCAACRDVANDEAALRDGLRALRPIDPPSGLWAKVQAELAAAEVSDAQRPAWRRALARWMPHLPRLGLAGVAFAAAATLLVVHAHHRNETATIASEHPSHVAVPHVAPIPAPPPPPVAPPVPPGGDDALDVTDDLAASAARTTARYAEAADELTRLAADERATWSPEHQQAFDTRVAALRKQITAADEGRPRQRAYRALIRYLQGAAIRDAVAANEGVLASPRGIP